MKASGTKMRRPRHPLASLLVAILSLLPASIAVLTSVMAYQGALVPYNSEGRYFDGVVVHHDGAQLVYGAIALFAWIVVGWMASFAYRLARPNNSFKPTPLRGSA
jgi:hypothetical protein